MSLRREQTRRVPIGLWFRVDRVVRYVARDADNNDPRIVRTRQPERDATPDRIFVGPITGRHPLIDHSYRSRTWLRVFAREIATSHKCDSERLQIICTHKLPAR